MIELVPAIDMIEGKCVRLTQGDYGTQKIYNEDPLEVALQFQDAGISRLHMVDLDGAKAGHIVNYRMLEKVAVHTDLSIDFGGGLKGDDDLRIAFECGARMVTGGSIAVKNPDMFMRWVTQYGSERIILGADAKNNKIAINGWKEGTIIDLLPFVKEFRKKGISKVICTDISRDGMLQGPAVKLYQDILQEIPGLYLIASGGVSSMDDIKRLAEANIPAVIFGKAIYEGHISLKEVESFIMQKG